MFLCLNFNRFTGSWYNFIHLFFLHCLFEFLYTTLSIRIVFKYFCCILVKRRIFSIKTAIQVVQQVYLSFNLSATFTHFYNGLNNHLPLPYMRINFTNISILLLFLYLQISLLQSFRFSRVSVSYKCHIFPFLMFSNYHVSLFSALFSRYTSPTGVK